MRKDRYFIYTMGFFVSTVLLFAASAEALQTELITRLPVILGICLSALGIFSSAIISVL
ncbi:MAG: hypothetical protein IJR55_01525 [Clostridia bacterium]|nr:hypothetical protein [Clostridia bacterium]